MRNPERLWGPLVLVLLGGCDDGPDRDDDPTTIDCGGGTLAGHLVIEGVDDLEPLNGVRAIEGELQIDKTEFADLDFLHCLEEVGLELTIFGNAALTDLSGLDALERLHGGLVFSENNAVTDLAGLPRLERVDGSVIINNNDAMTRISDLSLEAVGGLFIRDNDALETIDGLRGIQTVAGQLAITHNPSLCISSVNAVGEGITDPAEPRSNWSTRANNEGC